MDLGETLRLLKREVRKHPALLRVLQPPVQRATVALRRARMAAWYGDRILDAEAANAFMNHRIRAGTPSAFGKLGTLELELLAYDSQRSAGGERRPTPPQLRKQAFVNVGLFPPTDEALWRAYDEIRAALGELDVLSVFGSPGEPALMAREARNATALCHAAGFEPWDVREPWTAALRGKRVLVIHPFTESITAQYARRQSLWPGHPEVLPEFELQTLRMPLSAGIAPPQEADWSARLQRIRAEMDGRAFDVALIGAGGMSLPLAAHAKRMGSVGFHTGGLTQLIFGIRGRRWDDDPRYQRFFNDHWIRPLPEETPASSVNIEDGCYW